MNDPFSSIPKIIKESLHEGPHGYLEFLAFDVMKLGNDGLIVIHFGLYLRHHQSLFNHFVPVHALEPRMCTDRLGILLEA